MTERTRKKNRQNMRQRRREWQTSYELTCAFNSCQRESTCCINQAEQPQSSLFLCISPCVVSVLVGFDGPEWWKNFKFLVFSLLLSVSKLFHFPVPAVRSPVSLLHWRGEGGGRENERERVERERERERERVISASLCTCLSLT